MHLSHFNFNKFIHHSLTISTQQSFTSSTMVHSGSNRVIDQSPRVELGITRRRGLSFLEETSSNNLALHVVNITDGEDVHGTIMSVANELQNMIILSGLGEVSNATIRNIEHPSGIKIHKEKHTITDLNGLFTRDDNDQVTGGINISLAWCGRVVGGQVNGTVTASGLVQVYFLSVERLTNIYDVQGGRSLGTNSSVIGGDQDSALTLGSPLSQPNADVKL